MAYTIPMANRDSHGSWQRVRCQSATNNQTRVWDYKKANHHSQPSDPQANAILERVHKSIHNMLRTQGIYDSGDIDPDIGWTGILSAVRRAVVSTVHTTLRATPTQLVFGRDAMLNISFQADWNYIKERKQKRILQNNKQENAKKKAVQLRRR